MNEHDKKAAEIVRKAFTEGRVMQAARADDGAVMIYVGQGAGAAAAAAVDKAVRESTQAEAQAARELSDEASRRLVRHRDAMLRMLLGDLHAAELVPSADPHELDASGILKGFTYEDGAMEYEINGKVIVTFSRPTVAFDDEFMNVMQQYRVAL